jgi:hypothetical protein
MLSTAPIYKADAPVARGRLGSREECNVHRLPDKKIRLYGHLPLSPNPRGCPLCLYRVRRRAAARRRSPLQRIDGTDEYCKAELLLRILWLPHWPICTVTISRGMCCVGDNLQRSLARDAFTRRSYDTDTPHSNLRRFRDKVQLWKNT